MHHRKTLRVVKALFISLLVLGAERTIHARATAAVPFPRAELQAVVAAVRSQNLKPGQLYRFRLNEELSAESLRPLKQRVLRGRGRGLVWAEITENGTLKVIIETQDNGHFGEEGYLFSDTFVSTSDVQELGREWIVQRQLSPHWWVVFYNLG